MVTARYEFRTGIGWLASWSGSMTGWLAGLLAGCVPACVYVCVSVCVCVCVCMGGPKLGPVEAQTWAHKECYRKAICVYTGTITEQTNP
jgi:hypothetical protein